MLDSYTQSVCRLAYEIYDTDAKWDQSDGPAGAVTKANVRAWIRDCRGPGEYAALREQSLRQVIEDVSSELRRRGVQVGRVRRR